MTAHGKVSFTPCRASLALVIRSMDYHTKWLVTIRLSLVFIEAMMDNTDLSFMVLIAQIATVPDTGSALGLFAYQAWLDSPKSGGFVSDAA